MVWPPNWPKVLLLYRTLQWSGDADIPGLPKHGPAIITNFVLHLFPFALFFPPKSPSPRSECHSEPNKQVLLMTHGTRQASGTYRRLDNGICLSRHYGYDYCNHEYCRRGYRKAFGNGETCAEGHGRIYIYIYRIWGEQQKGRKRARGTD